VVIAAGVYAYDPPAELIEYRTEAEQAIVDRKES
jgi:hypothetical protein